MSQNTATLHLVCGKAASGKSTLAARLGQAERAIVIAEDDWLSALFADQMTTLPDYVRCAGKLRGIMGPHVVALLRAGLSVVLDFPANTVETRRWMRGLVDASGAAHRLHYLDVADEICRARLQMCNAGGDHPFAVSDAQFEPLLKHFVPPADDEGFNILRHEAP
ncbi:AAA family ATPase [Sinisalibacter aestuarii]|uniref:Cell division protein ZipA n=1 Tax=Sinisalibacter aestuarii TaxID=2949426 RepID=A0ABQ5LUW4_9RHOB|nr:ATP-binding protein [Sinisalibacter aestuarii]GKY87907.1 cell division protein ZipA [Sinisalibacter aestuarii]